VELERPLQLLPDQEYDKLVDEKKIHSNIEI
jgi:hypothetical protein